MWRKGRRGSTMKIMASTPFPLRLLISAPLLTSALHALSMPEQHEQKVRSFASAIAGALPRGKLRETMQTVTPEVGEMIATASGASVTAAALSFIAGKNIRLSATILAATVPALAAANYPLGKVPTSALETSTGALPERPAIAGWLGLAPLMAALAMAAMAESNDS